MFENLKDTARLLIEQDLYPVQGDRFQPTGFADLGAADYKRADGKRMLLVESAQSVANRLEKTCLKGDGPHITTELDGIPYVVAKLNGAVETETSSLIEAHRVNSPWIISDESFQADFVKRAAYEKGKPLMWSRIAAALFHYDPNSLIHGIFMANLGDGRVRFPRALSGFVEASDIVEAVSGGVKNNALDPTGKIRAKDYDKDVYGNVPYARVEYTARSIVAYFNLDLALIRGFELPKPAYTLLVALSLLKVRRFLSTGLRLRTACDLTPSGPFRVRAPEGFDVPDEAALLGAVKEAMGDCRKADLFANPPVTLLNTTSVAKADSKDTPAV
ncbi:MAG: type I-U CRISPR-associated RAMP protein Csb1/Cas7u [Bryobacteraceae bacterium]